MPFHLVPIGLGAASLGLFLLTGAAPKSSKDQPLPPKPGPGPGPGPNGRKTRPDPFPVGAGEATVIPNSLGGMNVRKGPGTGNPLIAANDAYNGTHVAVFAMGVPPDDGQGGEWWFIMTPGGGTGYARGIDGQGVHNFNLLSNPDPDVQQPTVTAGLPAAIGARNPYRPFGMVYDTVNAHRPRRFTRISGPATVASPAGTFLRPQPNAPGSLLLPRGTAVQVDEHIPADKREVTSPGDGGWARVRCALPGFPPVQGYVLSEWLVPRGGYGPMSVVGRPNVAPWAMRGGR